MSKKKKNEFLRSVKDRVETIQDMDKSKKIMAGGVIGVVALAAIIGVSMSGKSARSVVTETTVAVESSSTEVEVAAAQVMPMEKAGNEFPSLGIEVETEEPRPELLEEGVQHSYIEKVQERLMQLGFMDNDEPTDYFGEVTKAAVMIFQRQNGLAQDGIIGPSTLPLLMDENAKHYAAKLGDVGEDVKRIQNRLYELGYLASADMITGTYDEKTQEAALKLQQVNSLSEDGKVGSETMNLLYSDEIKANTLSLGEHSEVVQNIQNRLFELGYLTTRPDGTYGNDTELAVRVFQSKNDLVVDGYLGPSTRAVILSSEAKANGLVLGDENEQVARLQSLLAKAGYLNESNATGYFGELTESALKRFQSNNGLSADGRAGAQTFAKLSSGNTNGPSRNDSSNVGKSDKKSSGGSSGGGGSYSGSVGSMISIASSKIGSPYVWGAKGSNSFDCSGFVYWVLKQMGVGQSYITSSGWRNPGRYTRISSFSDIQAGDIVVVSGHVGIAAGGGEIIDASSSRGRVKRSSMSSWWRNNFIVAWRIF